MNTRRITVSAYGENILVHVPFYPLITLSVGEANRLWTDLQDAVIEAMKAFKTPGEGTGITLPRDDMHDTENGEKNAESENRHPRPVA